MGLFRRGLPPAARESLDLVGGERPIAWGAGPRLAGREEPPYVVATDRALHVGALWAPSRIPWDRISRATWQDPVLELTVQLRPGGRPDTVRLELDDPGEVPVVVRERVQASIVVSQHVPMEGEKGARIVARRDSDTGELRWSVVFDTGLDPRDPDLRARADEALADLRASWGV
ncbi:MAG: hypothetical protein R2737_06175 [Candidatus Nanopelagicales bacterium]